MSRRGVANTIEQPNQVVTSMVETPVELIDPESIVRLLHQFRFDLSTEKRLQADVEQAFIASKIPFEREKALSQTDIPDFFIEGGIVVECKMRNKSKKVAIYEQLCRYASHPTVTALILASNVSMGLPAEINGKPLYSASLSRGWI